MKLHQRQLHLLAAGGLFPTGKPAGHPRVRRARLKSLLFFSVALSLLLSACSALRPDCRNEEVIPPSASEGDPQQLLLGFASTYNTAEVPAIMAYLSENASVFGLEGRTDIEQFIRSEVRNSYCVELDNFDSQGEKVTFDFIRVYLSSRRSDRHEVLIEGDLIRSWQVVP